MRRMIPAIGAVLVAGGLVLAWVARPTAAQDRAPAGGPTAVVDKVMVLVAAGRVDDAVGMMDGLKNYPDLKEDARAKLLRLRDGQQGTYRGYDVAATVRFTPRLQTVDVLAYYDLQPVLLRFQFYHPVAGEDVPWTVLDFRVNADVGESVEVLREDSPSLVLGRGGRATR